MKTLMLFITILATTLPLSAQIAINTDGTAADNSAMLDVQSTTKGMLVPRMTVSQRASISTPLSIGLLIFLTDSASGFYYYDGTIWQRIVGSNDVGWVVSGNNMNCVVSGNIGIGTETPTHKLHISDTTSNDVLRLTGTGAYGSLAKLNFGDANFVYLSEDIDDHLTIHADSRIALTSTNVGVGTTTPDASAALEVSNTTKGFLPPRMTTDQMHAITSPSEGLMVYNTSLKSIYFYDGVTWNKLYNNDGTASDPIIYGGQTYQTVIIGDQIWMAENLNIGIMIDSLGNQLNNGTIEKYCYRNSMANCDTYGGLYQWDEMMQYVTTEGTQGICSPGWHIPTDTEWATLTSHLGGTSIAGGKMKETDITHWYSPNTGATNSSGFTALPGGYRHSGGPFNGLGDSGFWWSSTEDSGTDAWNRYMVYSNGFVYRDDDNKAYGFSVRCLKN